MRIISLSLLLALGLFSACGNSSQAPSTKSDTTMAAAPKPIPTSALGQQQTGEMMQLLASYYDLKDALVATDTAKADAAAARLTASAEQFKNSIGSLAQASSINPHMEQILKGSDSILAAKGESIETQREHFSYISESLYAVLRAAELKNGGVYLEHCPMAMDDKGANWLSAESEIKNPYFGKKMIECGSVTDSL
ncbi:MAG: DUF3347 domain-containing protein [Bacteroidetes bacterium]|nr:DUF3347 domain-containing protein [Bacteroidota bacterium]MBS1629787.1 DUF3347 domain-containing protein [Bacteroidota bacterium]